MQPAPASLSDVVVGKVRDMIVGGALGDGDRINEVALAEQLGVSRTPLREGLMRLAAEGALINEPRHGFYVAPLNEEDLEQIYPMRGILDPEALRMAGVPSKETLDRLDQINRRLEQLRKPAEVLATDDEWHLLLLDHCPNRVIIDLIRHFIDRTRRYELALMRDRRNLVVSTAHHAEITAALRRGRLDVACAILRRNMQHGKEPIVEWLRQRNHRPMVARKRPRTHPIAVDHGPEAPRNRNSSI